MESLDSKFLYSELQTQYEQTWIEPITPKRYSNTDYWPRPREICLDWVVLCPEYGLGLGRWQQNTNKLLTCLLMAVMLCISAEVGCKINLIIKRAC